MRRLLGAAVLAVAVTLFVGPSRAEEMPRLPRAGDVIPVPWHCPVADVPLRVLDYATRGFAGAAQALVSMAVGAGRCWGSQDDPAEVRLEAVVHAQELGRGWMEVWRVSVGADGAGPARGAAGDRTAFVAFHVEPVRPEAGPAPSPHPEGGDRAGPAAGGQAL